MLKHLRNIREIVVGWDVNREICHRVYLILKTAEYLKKKGG